MRGNKRKAWSISAAHEEEYNEANLHEEVMGALLELGGDTPICEPNEHESEDLSVKLVRDIAVKTSFTEKTPHDSNVWR